MSNLHGNLLPATWPIGDTAPPKTLNLVWITFKKGDPKIEIMGRLAIIEDDSCAANSGAAASQSETKTTQNLVNTSNSRKGGGGVSDESGYYEGDELPNDDSIEIVYVNKPTANNHNQVSITLMDSHKNQSELQAAKLASIPKGKPNFPKDRA